MPVHPSSLKAIVLTTLNCVMYCIVFLVIPVSADGIVFGCSTIKLKSSEKAFGNSVVNKP